MSNRDPNLRSWRKKSASLTEGVSQEIVVAGCSAALCTLLSHFSGSTVMSDLRKFNSYDEIAGHSASVGRQINETCRM